MLVVNSYDLLYKELDRIDRLQSKLNRIVYNGICKDKQKFKEYYFRLENNRQDILNIIYIFEYRLRPL